MNSQKFTFRANKIEAYLFLIEDFKAMSSQVFQKLISKSIERVAIRITCFNIIYETILFRWGILF